VLTYLPQQADLQQQFWIIMMICPSSCFSWAIWLRILLTLSGQGFFAAAAFGHGFLAQQGFLQ
jgi:hypothetical protein